ncbi:guanine nucleotide exchange factor in Golgi transport N-terminal-domain-containing protein [Irpex rosettiformis]|uniref:Guanine nucleotide exchange factor in Golgi transport N-terminal-domain-containing protein n=1 Tax=Irpex rosettiformis TaxID=378272 RepID=A0ACB8TVL1_9APHY|nr:guanine nucleotide exchange factor in Golgi transport N-terminal-domain-containing protein [Irpex rosettiformis]
MGCATKNAKVVMISLGSLQRLIALKAVPTSAVSIIITTLTDCMNQGVDIQLRILQTLLSLITNFPAVHGDLLGEALLLCFRLQESRIAVVSSTAAATLRQLVMFVVDKVVDEDRRDELTVDKLSDITLPDGQSKSLGPSAHDAYAVFEDLCLLANSERPNFLKLESLRKTFALELIESVLTNYHDLFRKHNELLLLLQHHLCPLVLKALSDRPSFPLTLRSTRVVFLLLKQFSAELSTEAEVFLMLLIKIVSADTAEAATPSQSTDTVHAPHGIRPQWMRVLAMEIMRGLCSDAELMRNVWARYDAEESGSKVFTSLVTALNRLVTEKPHLLGVSAQMGGIGVATQTGEGASGSVLDVGGVAGMVANAASATVSGVVGMMGSEAGLSLQGSAMKLQCIDQLDKADSPPIPEPYIYLLGVQCLVSLCEGFASFVGPLYNSLMVQRPRAAGEPVIRAPPAIDLTTLSQDDPNIRQLKTVHDMIDSGWPALLAALSFVISTNLSDELFVDVLASYQAITNVSGMLDLTTPRDAFFNSLAKSAIPARVVSSLESYIESPMPRTPLNITENLGLTSPVQAPGLSERNLACLKVYIASALFLAGSLADSWFNILEALQNADYVLTNKGAKVPPQTPGKRSSMGTGGLQSVRSISSGPGRPLSQVNPPTPHHLKHPMLADLDPDSLDASIQRLFDASKNLEDSAFRDFIGALCKLSASMVGMQRDEGEVVSLSESADEFVASPSATLLTDTVNRRRVSGIHLPRTMRSGDFGINKLGGVAKLNIYRLIYRDPDIGWNIVTSHLLAVIKHTPAPQTIRIQAARILDDILVIVPRNLTSTGELRPKVQRRVLDVLSQQIMTESSLLGSSTAVEIRRMGLESLHQILQASGHTLVVGWEIIFEMLGSVCKSSLSPPGDSSGASTPSTSRRPPPLGTINEKNYTSLVKIAFQSLTLVCDSLSELSPEHLRLCISTLGQFGRQADTNIALTAAESLLWGVSDSIQMKRKDVEREPEYSALWMFLLLEILGLCTDGRPEVRVGAIQTLFRTMQLYGATLSLETWDECIWKVTFPLLDSITSSMRQASVTVGDAEQNAYDQWDESKILALQFIGTIFKDFLATNIMHLELFLKAWEVFVQHIQDAWLHDNRTISAPALRCLDKAINAIGTADSELSGSVSQALEVGWSACSDMGQAILEKAGSTDALPNPFTQESLVALIEVIRSIREVYRKTENKEWTLERLTKLMTILKGALTYPGSPDFRTDVDSLSPVQAIVLEAIDGIDLTGQGVPSLILRDLSEYSTLSFLAAFDAPSSDAPPQSTSGKQNRSPKKRVTYIALSKKTMPQLVDLFLKFKSGNSIYNDGTVESILSAYAIPMKLKYDCPAPSKFTKDDPLWKTATTNFLRVVRECGIQIQKLNETVSSERVEGIWRQVIESFRGAILADCSAAENLPLETQHQEESFDLSLIASLEIDVVPHLGDSRVPDHIIAQLANVLQQGSQIREDPEYRPLSPASFETTSQRGSTDLDTFGKHSQVEGTTEPGRFLPRERFSYWCFDLLFLICSSVAQEQLVARKRVAALSIPALLKRCKITLVTFIADEALRGGLPFPRAREEELLYVLKGLLQLRLWPGSLWAALSSTPSEYSSDQPLIDGSLDPSKLIADAVKRSTKAHLFHFYTVLCEIVSIPRKAPSAWVMSQGPRLADLKLSGEESITKEIERLESASTTGKVVELDARQLARDCLKELAEEMGIAR